MRLINALSRCSLAAAIILVTGSPPAAHAADRAGGPPNAGQAPEAQKESDWVDARWNKMDVGQFIASNLELPGARIAKGLSIKVGDADQGTVCYDTATASWRGAWLGGFVRFDAARYGLLRAPAVVGRILAQAPAPANGTNAIRYHGLHLNGRRVTLDYSVGGTRILESPWLHTAAGIDAFTRTLVIEPASQHIAIGIANAAEKPTVRTAADETNLTIATGTNLLAVQITGAKGEIQHENKSVALVLPPSTSKRTLIIRFCSTTEEGRSNTPALLSSLPIDSTSDLTKPGAARWLPELQTTGQRGLDLDILAVDTLTVPYANPWNALMFLAGVDFTPDGAAYACTIHGDVWRITGIDDTLRNLRWKRFATGLFQPLGLKVRDGAVFVLGRDQITRLHDENGDGEADFYESFFNGIRTSTGGHDYVTCLEKDDSGSFYYIDPRGLHRVAPDGTRSETIASGWRNPNGMGVSPDGRVLTAAPQQGEWTPSSQISQARTGGYYGYGGPRVSPERPLGYDAPLCWIPHSVDNSSGSQVWVPQGKWGALGGQMLHLLWGRCGLMLVLRDEVNGVPQGAVVPLPGKLLSGPNRGSFSPLDGQLYIAGSTGWQTAAAKDGALQRVRFTGKPVHLPTGWHAHHNGIAVTFAEPLDRSAAEDVGSYSVHQWNYRYAAQYGSKDWSVANPDKEGRDEVTVKSAKLLPDGRTVFLEMPGLTPVMQMEIKYSLNATTGKSLRSQLWLTLNALDGEKHP